MRPQQFAEEDDSGDEYSEIVNLASMRPQQFAEEDQVEHIPDTRNNRSFNEASAVR